MADHVHLLHKEAADYIRMPEKTLYQHNSRGTGPRRIRVGRRVLYRKADLDAWLESHEVESSA